MSQTGLQAAQQDNVAGPGTDQKHGTVAVPGAKAQGSGGAGTKPSVAKPSTQQKDSRVAVPAAKAQGSGGAGTKPSVDNPSTEQKSSSVAAPAVEAQASDSAVEKAPGDESSAQEKPADGVPSDKSDKKPAPPAWADMFDEAEAAEEQTQAAAKLQSQPPPASGIADGRLPREMQRLSLGAGRGGRGGRGDSAPRGGSVPRGRGAPRGGRAPRGARGGSFHPTEPGRTPFTPKALYVAPNTRNARGDLCDAGWMGNRGCLYRDQCDLVHPDEIPEELWEEWIPEFVIRRQVMRKWKADQRERNDRPPAVAAWHGFSASHQGSSTGSGTGQAYRPGTSSSPPGDDTSLMW